MILKETLRNIVRSQKSGISSFDIGIEREKTKEIELSLPFALILSGVRRCGKSTLLHQLMNKTKEFYYFNFEDTRLANFEAEDFQKLNDIFMEEYKNKTNYFFDEIQNAPGWEIFVRSMLDKKKHFIITGSNASLLSKELGTKLTGRHLTYELFPFSYAEFLSFSKKRPGKESFEEYFLKGGFPEYLKTKKSEVLQELLNDILIRDIAIRHKIRNIKILREMALYLITNVGREFSYNSIKKMFKLGSTNSVISFISFFEDSYLLFSVPKFDFSYKKRIVGQKKIYSIDSGLTIVNSASFFEDRGNILENIVFLQLRRKNRDIFYFKGRNECDFIVKDGKKIREAMQVCYIFNEECKDREINGLVEALDKFGLDEGFILTYNQEDEIKINKKRIIIKPVWKWLLNEQAFR